MARADSVTVSMAAETMGILIPTFRVSMVLVSAWDGTKSLLAGIKSTSSNVMPSATILVLFMSCSVKGFRSGYIKRGSIVRRPGTVKRILAAPRHGLLSALPGGYMARRNKNACLCEHESGRHSILCYNGEGCGGRRNHPAIDNLTERIWRANMSMNQIKGPVWGVAVIVGLIVATGLVAGYVDRPGTSTCSQAVASKGDCAACPAQGDCAACPAKGTEACCKQSGTCPAGAGTCPNGSCNAENVAATCPAGAAMMAQTAETGGATCPHSGAMAQKADDAGATCPVKAAAEGQCCSGGQCPASK